MTIKEFTEGNMQPKRNCDKQHVLIGARCSRAQSSDDPGHAWFVLCKNSDWDIGVAWDNGKSTLNAPARSFIGYYPALDEIPDLEGLGYNNTLEAFYNYFINNHVTGMKTIDHLARNAIKRTPEKNFYWEGFRSTTGSLEKVWKDTFIPDDEESIEDGFYGLNIDNENVNNCVSWVIRIINPLLDPMEQFPLEKPPKVKKLIETIGEKMSWVDVG
jgi:hypothetical protein